eukprot:CAMPEP_0176499490 /NCGR_PEP_ID=MMETSP0200_2-20121128/12955_1 /TAXON_ID=947934 /ORGANISM="Chaetoceros sp., Strain GSL56" /LENGTH=294 /DNA_ID=CAMNT_0017897913 /DNA_START=95 /DNA_END=979 /DNA_ORIENTATION=+
MIRFPNTAINNGMFVKYARSLKNTSSFSIAASSDVTTSINNADSKNNITTPDISLFQYTICPFCNINKALLAYTNTPYTVIEVNPLTKDEIKFSEDYRKVPIAMIDGVQVNDSKTINDTLLTFPFVLKNLSQRNVLSLDAFQDSPSARRWETFAREDLAPILYPNICSSLGDSYQAFGYVDNVDNFTSTQKFFIRGIGSLAMYFAASKIKSKRKIVDEREALRNALTQWEEEGLKKGENTFGSGSDSPDMGDLCMYGVLKSVSGLKVHDEVILDRDGAVVDWYLRMENDTSGNT